MPAWKLALFQMLEIERIQRNQPPLAHDAAHVFNADMDKVPGEPFAPVMLPRLASMVGKSARAETWPCALARSVSVMLENARALSTTCGRLKPDGPPADPPNVSSNAHQRAW